MPDELGRPRACARGHPLPCDGRDLHVAEVVPRARRSGDRRRRQETGEKAKLAMHDGPPLRLAAVILNGTRFADKDMRQSSQAAGFLTNPK